MIDTRKNAEVQYSDPDDWDDSNIILIPIFGGVRVNRTLSLVLAVGVGMLSWLILISIATCLGLSLQKSTIISTIAIIVWYFVMFIISVLRDYIIRCSWFGWRR